MEFRLLRADEIECKIKTCSSWGVMILLYKNSRCDMNILDETVGVLNWQREHEVINGNLFCNVGVRDENGGWVWKQDVGVESNTEKEKGEASDSFKRACVCWGIGRELYTAPRMYVYAKDLKTLKENNGRWTCTDYFTVQDIQYTGRKICYVRIRNEKTGNDLEFGNMAKYEETACAVISQEKANALQIMVMEKNVNLEKLLAQYGVDSIGKLNERQHADIVRRLNR